MGNETAKISSNHFVAFIKFHFSEGQNKVAKFRKMKYFECVNIYFNKQYQCFPEKLREIEFDEKIAKMKNPFFVKG